MINIFCSLNNISGTSPLLNQLNTNRKNDAQSNHLVLVPDRCALNGEKAVFETLNIESCFDIEVLSFSRLCKKILGISETTSKATNIMIIKKLLNENKNKLKCFANTLSGAGFAEDIYNTIAQLKSCKITSEQLKISGDNYLANKMHDLNIIFEAFEKYLCDNNLCDASDEFDKFETAAEGSDFLKNCHIYIDKFDSFTLQGYKLIEKLIDICKSVSIVVTKSGDSLNSHIYLNDVFTAITGIAKTKKITPNIIYCNSTLGGQFEYLQKNLFSYKTRAACVEESKIKISECIDFYDEIIRTATLIKKGIISDNLRYKDFAVAISDLAAKQSLVEKVFAEFGISFYVDIPAEFKNSILYKFIEQCFELYQENYRSSNIISFAKNLLCSFDQNELNDFEDYIIKYSIEGSLFLDDKLIITDEYYQNYSKIRLRLLDVLLPAFNVFEKAKTVKQYIEGLKLILTGFDTANFLNELTELYAAEGLLACEKQTAQYMQKLNEVLEGLDEILGKEVFSFDEFADILFSGLMSQKVSTVPLSCDSVFVGDASSSFFSRVKRLFVAGAADGSLPRILNDCGIITDSEISELSNKYKIEPTVKTINAREKFKLFNLLLTPTDILYISYSGDKSGKIKGAVFVEQIKKMFMEPWQGAYEPLRIFNNNYNTETFSENLAHDKNALNRLINMLREIYDGALITNAAQYSTLYNYFKNKGSLEGFKLDLFEYKNQPQKLKQNLFFTHDKVSVSQVESYYNCPFKHFLDYGLKLDQKLICAIDSLTTGNILHCFVDMLYKNNVLPLEDNKIKNTAEGLFDNILSEDKFNALTKLPQNKIQLLELKKEAVRLTHALNTAAKQSDFKAYLTEARFNDNGKIKSIDIKVGKRILKLVGAVDRIDVFGDYFRIIDYKTGVCDTDVENLYFGKKLQLYVYQEVVSKSLKLKPAGSYYLPVKSTFSEGKKTLLDLYKLKGYTLQNEDVILASDNSLNGGGSSSLIEVRKTKEGYHSYSKLLTEQQLAAFAKYATEMISKACTQILQGNIKPSPLKLKVFSTCDYCEYNGICRFDKAFGNAEREHSEKVTKENITEVKYE